MNKNLDSFKKHLLEELEAIDERFSFNIEWFTDTQKNNYVSRPYASDRKNVDIVLTLLPSRSYGDGTMEQQVEIKAVCFQEDIDDLIDVLVNYQTSSVNKKYFTDTTMFSETWLTPYVEQNFINDGVQKKSILSMSGTVTISEDVVDVDYISVDGEKHKILDYIESGTSIQLSVGSFNDNGRIKTSNKNEALKFDIKIKNTNSKFCNNCRMYRNGKISPNKKFKIKIVYTDGEEVVTNVKIASCVLNARDGAIPTLTLSLTED